MMGRVVKFLGQLNPTFPQPAASNRTVQVYMADKVKYDGVPSQMNDLSLSSGKIYFGIEY